MDKALTFLRRYPWVAAAVGVGIAGLGLEVVVDAQFSRWLITLFAGLVAFTQGIHMVKAIAQGHWGLDLLAVTAIISTLLVGEYWASLIIVLMLTGGEALEDAAAHRATRELTSLFTRVPQQAHRKTADGSIEEVPAHEIRVGDRFIVKPSELVPVDGELVSERGEFDESSLTGESLPAARIRGDIVFSGSLNGSVAVELIAKRVAAESEYQRIVSLVEQAAGSKAPLVRLADRYAIPFTGLAYLIAGVAWFLSGDPVRFAEVLVVATPCPLLIAAPVAFMGGMSRAAKSGVVIKDAGTLERLSRIRSVAFDKTGTLTHGEPEVTGIIPSAPGRSADELLSLVASAERYSSHVLAKAIVHHAEHLGLRLMDATHAEEVATDGVVATIGGHRILVGKPGFLTSHGIEVPQYNIAAGETVVYSAVEDRFAGFIILKDVVRDEALAVLTRLRALGIERTVMISGDAQATAAAIAEGLGITEVHGECLPADKVKIVGGITPEGVMMVGDGVNDAPVLAASDVGVALGAKGSTAASESADVVILVDNLSVVSQAVEIGQSTIRIALQSIWLGIIISVGLMLIASVGLLPAIAGALLQEVVDLVAIVGALRAVRDPKAS